VFCSSSCPPGPVRVAQPSRPGPGAQRAKAWARPRVLLSYSARIEEAQELPASGGAGAAPPPPNHRPGQLAAHIALGITWGGVVGDRGHRKGQLRVLGRPSALHTKEPWTGGAPGRRGVARGPDFFFATVP
jgi:hypothetical protein